MFVEPVNAIRLDSDEGAFVDGHFDWLGAGIRRAGVLSRADQEDSG